MRVHAIGARMHVQNALLPELGRTCQPEKTIWRVLNGWHSPCVGLFARRAELTAVTVMAAVDFITATLLVLTIHATREPS
jgi:hypothetical protein